nr:hypothetical protein Iba_scaffold21085CG0010 [Ipomoea batatas]
MVNPMFTIDHNARKCVCCMKFVVDVDDGVKRKASQSPIEFSLQIRAVELPHARRLNQPYPRSLSLWVNRILLRVDSSPLCQIKGVASPSTQHSIPPASPIRFHAHISTSLGSMATIIRSREIG